MVLYPAYARPNPYMSLQSDKLSIISWLSRLQDEEIIQRLYFLMQRREQTPLSPQQQQVLEGRLKEDGAGKMEFISWEQAKTNIKNKS